MNTRIFVVEILPGVTETRADGNVYVSRRAEYVLASAYPREPEDAECPDGCCESCWQDTGNAVEADGRDVDAGLCAEHELDRLCAAADAAYERMRDGE